MALTRAQINAIVEKMHGTRDLGSGGILALKELAYALLTEITTLQTDLDTAEQTITNIRNAPVVLESSSLTMTGGFVAVGGGGISVIGDSPNPGEILITS